MHQQILLRKGLVRQDSCPAGSHTSVLLCQSCESQRGHRRGTSDTLEGLWWLLWAAHMGTEAQNLLLFPSWFQTTSSGYLPQTARGNACVNHSTQGPSWGNKLHRVAADETSQKSVFSSSSHLILEMPFQKQPRMGMKFG